MSTALLAVLLIVNTVISIFDAYVAGRIWKESTGFMKLVAWAALGMSACGFLMVSAFLIAGGSSAVGLISEYQFEIVLKLAYVLIIIPLLGFGTIITIQSWIDTVKTRSFTSGAVAVWNTAAMVSNTVDAVEHSGGLLKEIFDYFKEDGDKDSDDDSLFSKGRVVIILVVAAAISVGLTYLFWSKGRLRAVSIEIDEARDRAAKALSHSA